MILNLSKFIFFLRFIVNCFIIGIFHIRRNIFYYILNYLICIISILEKINYLQKKSFENKIYQQFTRMKMLIFFKNNKFKKNYNKWVHPVRRLIQKKTKLKNLIIN